MVLIKEGGRILYIPETGLELARNLKIAGFPQVIHLGCYYAITSGVVAQCRNEEFVSNLHNFDCVIPCIAQLVEEANALGYIVQFDTTEHGERICNFHKKSSKGGWVVYKDRFYENALAMGILEIYQMYHKNGQKPQRRAYKCRQRSSS